MKRFSAFAIAMLFIFGFAPCAFAQELLARPGEGQIIFLEADNRLDYSLDFPLCALKEVQRDEDNLILTLPAAQIILKGFFTQLGEWRSLSFSDGNSIGGADFDREGNFTGQYSRSDTLEKDPVPHETFSPQIITARYTQYGVEILQDGHAVYGELRDACMEMLSSLYPVGKPDWQRVYSLFFEFSIGSDGSLLPLRCVNQFTNGITARSVRPQVVCISDSLSLSPISVGRASVNYENSLGVPLLSLDVRCLDDDSGLLQLSTVCSCCGENQGERLHFNICGHYSCSEDFDASSHALAECGIAGHCSSEGDHSRCKNCLEPVCNGQPHGYGQCKHVHNYMMVSIYTSRCVSCGHEYTSPPRTG